MRLEEIYEEQPPEFYETRTHAEGPSGKLPLTEDFLRNAPSGYIFSMTQGRGMGWEADDLANDDIMMISTLGGLRDADGNPTALGLHTGHFELGMLLDEAAKEFKRLDHIPYATFVSDPCDGRSQGTTGMFDSLPYRNDAAMVFRRQIRSLPTRTAVLGVASCDKGLPALMMALVSQHDTPTILVPGGATLKAYDHEDLGTVQTVGIRFAAGEMTLEEAMIEGCRACASGGGGCQFLGTAATSQVVGEALGLALPHSALCPSGEDIWKNLGTASARALLGLKREGITTKDVITDKSIENAMVLHAAFGGSTNLLLHLTAIAYEAGCKVPTVDDWERINKKVPRLVSVMPIGPVHFPTGVAYLAGGVPEAMLHLRDLGLLHLDALTVTGQTVGANLEWWEKSERRARVQERLLRVNKIPKDDVIMDPEKAHRNGLTSTVTFPKGNIAPEGSVVKSTAIDPSVVGEDGVFRQTGPARIFVHEKDAMAALKHGKIHAGDVMVIAGIGPSGTGMEETYQLTSALKKLPYGKHVSLITDARFSGVSTGACFGHVGPEALAGGPIGKLQEGDIIEIVVDTVNLEGSLNFVGRPGEEVSWEEGATILAERPSNPDLAPDEDLPDDTRLWAALQDASGGIWRGCVYDVDRIVETLQAGRAALKEAGVAWAQ
ncbi:MULTISPECIES: YjhG/YagF family D-xylonate dehydratase [Actinotignum]|uniref:YjhG/YagF family D-xylonate dehydratase n=1 Tax=Actinotignum TaxID=1653174 RepID=UPI002A82F9A4|nr:YjhG/YagF family D-xylonate dehydratase [Actinotignum timonense]MDY5134124.1 YjhG/YagF family D-xylonate dehydratase [Actinotignum timonense]MDY5144550.1 YjhG/YagF family D-xylonate dehydratase [Actinotignum timonense]